MLHRRAAILAASALVAVACNTNEGPTTPTPNDDEVRYAVVGASDAIGVGGSVPCAPFDLGCPNGTGYAYVIKRRFEADGLTVEFSNRGFPGFVLSEAMLTLGREIGRNDIPGTFMNQIVPFIPSDATHISIFAGGNDARLIADALRAGRGAGDIRGFVDAQVNQFGMDLVELVGRLKARAPGARIAALNLPNLAAAPYMSSATIMEKGVVQRIAVGIADRVNALTSQGIIVADLLCDPRAYLPSSYSSLDGFHPSDQGYAVMADLLYPALRNGSAATPSANCPQRTLVPVY